MSIYDEHLGEDLHFPFMLDIHILVPKFTRTVSDAAEDELYTSNMEAPTTNLRLVTCPTPTPYMPVSGNPESDTDTAPSTSTTASESEKKKRI